MPGVKIYYWNLVRRIFTSLSLVLVGGIVILLTACSADGHGKPSSTSIPTKSTPLVEIETSTPVSSQVVSNFPTATSTPIQRTQITPQVSTPDLSNINDPGANFKAWRPPVYPVPWIPSVQDHFFFQNPIAATDIDGAFSTYGYGDVFFKDVVHTGIDIPGAIGTPILAAGNGVIIYAGSGVYRGGNNILDDPYGNAVVIEHDFKYKGQALFTLYAHLDQILVEEGDQVKTGDKIGLLGNTGKTTGPHLHFEVRLGENEYFASRNPDLWLSPPQGWGILVGQILTYSGRPLEQQEVYLYKIGDTPEQLDVENNLWIAKSYQNEAINSDPYYKENLTITNLPAGSYYLQIPVTSIGFRYQETITILPGQVTYIKFNLWRGFTKGLPPTPEIQFTPAP